MNLLFLKIKVDKYYILWIFLSFCTGILANDSIPDSTFDEQCKSSDAYLLYRYTDVSYIKNWSYFKRKSSVQYKLVVNNRSGVEDFAFLNLSNSVSDHLESIKIQTLKADHTVVELDSSLAFEHLSDNEQSEPVKYPIPGVEPGDTIEISYVYSEDLKDNELIDFVNLYSFVPSIHTEYTITTPPDLMVRYKLYNGFPEPQVLSNDTILYCLFKMEKVNGLSENQHTCLPCELPYLYYSVENKESEIRTWKDVYNQEFNVLTQPILLDYEKSSYYKRWKKRVIGDASDSSKYYKFNLLHKEILDNFQIEPPVASEMFKSSGYFLKEKHFDPISIRRLYRQLLEDLEIEYWAVFARSKQGGQIDPYYIRKGEFDHIFFLYENGHGAYDLLYPHDVSYKYQINEIPTSLYNTQAVMVKPYLKNKIRRDDKFINYDLKLAEADSVTVNVIKLPGMSANYNYMKQIFYCDVDLNEKNTTFTSKFSVSGGLSTDIRSFFSLLRQNKEISDFYEALDEYEGDDTGWDIDSITNNYFNNNKPFIFSVDAKGTFKNSLSFLNDSLISISLDNLFQHSKIESKEDSIDLNYYLDYSYSDFCMFIFSFPCDIEVLNIDNYNTDLKNDLGEYLFNINLVGNNQLVLQTNYRITKDMIPKEEYWQLRQLNELVKEIKNMRLLVKIKDS